MDRRCCWYAQVTCSLRQLHGGPESRTKRSAGYKRHITAEAAAGSSLHDLRVGQGRFTRGCGYPLFHVCLSAAGLPEQTLLPLKLQLVQACEHGWVHWRVAQLPANAGTRSSGVASSCQQTDTRYGGKWRPCYYVNRLRKFVLELLV